MTDHAIMNITLILVCIVMVGTIVAFIANTINTPPAEYKLQTRNTTDTWTSSCGCDCDDDDANDVMLIKCFQDVARDKELDDETRKAASIALVKILMDYGPDDDDEEETTNDPKPV